MAVRIITGPPGSGKTLLMTHFAISEFKKENSFIDVLKEKQNYIYKNYIYSNYPILLKKSKKMFKYTNDFEIYDAIPIKLVYDEFLKKEYYTFCDIADMEYFGMFSNKLIFTDMRLKYLFPSNASFYIDEVQYIYDSMEYKDFPDCVAHFFQVHRHLGYNNIYTNSQSLSRVIKRLLCVSEEFFNIVDRRNILKLYYKMELAITTNINFSKNVENDMSDNPNIDYEVFRFFCKRVNTSYLTKYLGALNYGLPPYIKGQYSSMLMSKSDIIRGFMVSSAEKDELQKQLF